MRVFLKKDILKNCAKFPGKHLYGSLFFFLVSFAKFLGTPPVAASGKTNATTLQKGRDKKPKKRYEIE